MKKNKNKLDSPNTPIEELTTLMHSTFTIPEERDREFRVWSAVGIMEDTGWPLERILKALDHTAEEFGKYKNTLPTRNE